MKTLKIIAFGLAAMTTMAAAAQSAYDAYNLIPNQLRGTARFVAMGGAFTSLGGDLSSMTQNPAGLAMYRSSDIGFTFDISPRTYNATSNKGKTSSTATPVNFSNVGYAGVANLKNDIVRSVQWGFSYNRLANYDRVTSGYVNPTAGSLTNYIASYTNGVNSDNILDVEGNDPYANPDNDWLSVLAYNSFMINNASSSTEYTGLYQTDLYKNGTVGDAIINQRERGYLDEYNIDLATNISDVVFIGLGVGIYDVGKTIDSYYSENMSNANIYNKATDRTTAGNAGFNLYNYQRIDGSGANFKFGVVVRPVEMLRIGAAIHTPTYLHLTHTGYGSVDYEYTPNGTQNTNKGEAWTPDYSYRSRITTPWRFMVGASVMLGSKGILSVDYERVAYNDMKLKRENQNFGYGGFEDNEFANHDVKADYKASNILRVGAEYRVLNFLTLRAGYNWQGKAVKNEVYDGGIEVYTAGTNPSYSFDGDTQSVSAGVGFRYKGWYIDLTYQHVRQDGVYSAYTPTKTQPDTPTLKLSRDYNNIVISTGFRF